MDKSLRGDKFRQRVAFNIAKQALIGKKNKPLFAQANDFMMTLQQSSFALESGEVGLSRGTYYNGWKFKTRSTLKTRAILDAIVKINQNNLEEMNLRVNHDKRFHQRNLPVTERKNRLVNQDGINVGYFPGVELLPSKWICREANKDIFHAHLESIDQLGMGYSSDTIQNCFTKLIQIHSRWDPTGGSYFYEALVDPYITDFDYAEMNDGAIEFFEPDGFIHVYDYYSPAKISEYLVSIPMFKDISTHPLLDFWVIDYATSVLLFYWLMYSRRMKRMLGAVPNCAHEAREKIVAGKSLFWEENGVETALSYLSVYSTKNIHYEQYYENFSLYSRRYEEILNSFGITKKEIIEELTAFSERNLDFLITP